MSTPTYLVSAAMGTMLLAAVVLAATGRDWREYSPPGNDDGSELLSWAVHDQTAWILGFLLLCLGAIGGTMFALGGGGETVMLAGIGLIAVGFLAVAVYTVAKTRGHPHSHAVGEAVVTVGALALVAVVARLLMTAGA